VHILSFDTPFEYVNDVRTLLGVTSAELTDDNVFSISIIGQAEQDIYALVPTFKTLIEDPNTPELTLNQLMIAFINLVAYYAYGPLKVLLLSSETDSKTTATRFKEALTRDPNEFKAAATKALYQAGIGVQTGRPDLFSRVSPGTDVITGV
jgi:hypothetical protein